MYNIYIQENSFAMMSESVALAVACVFVFCVCIVTPRECARADLEICVDPKAVFFHIVFRV